MYKYHDNLFVYIYDDIHYHGLLVERIMATPGTEDCNDSNLFLAMKESHRVLI